MRLLVVLVLGLLVGCAGSRIGGAPQMPGEDDVLSLSDGDTRVDSLQMLLAEAEVALGRFDFQEVATKLIEFDERVAALSGTTPAEDVMLGWLTAQAAEIEFFSQLFYGADPAEKLARLYASNPDRIFQRFFDDGTTTGSPACYRLFAISGRQDYAERGFLRMLKLVEADTVKTFRLRMLKASTLMGLGIEEGRPELERAMELLAGIQLAKVEDHPEYGSARTLKALDLARSNDFAAASALIDEIIASNPPVSMKPRLDRYGPGLKEIAADWPAEQALWEAEKDLPRVEFETDRGRMVITLFEDDTPNTVASFITLVESGFYDGLVFHRVVPHFVVQGGDPDGTGSGGPGYSIKRELGRKHFRGSIGMARSADPDSAGSQFYFCLNAATTHHLDAGYCVFGRVSEGLDVMDKLRLGGKVIKARVLNKRAHDYKVEKLPEKKE